MSTTELVKYIIGEYSDIDVETVADDAALSDFDVGAANYTEVLFSIEDEFRKLVFDDETQTLILHGDTITVDEFFETAKVSDLVAIIKTEGNEL